LLDRLDFKLSQFITTHGKDSCWIVTLVS
jgi:hypothetical protein